MEVTIQNALCRALINAVGHHESFYDWECQRCEADKEADKPLLECTCKEGFEGFRKSQEVMFSVYHTIKDELKDED